MKLPSPKTPAMAVSTLVGCRDLTDDRAHVGLDQQNLVLGFDVIKPRHAVDAAHALGQRTHAVERLIWRQLACGFERVSAGDRMRLLRHHRLVDLLALLLR